MNGLFRTSINSSRRKYNSSSHCLYKEKRADQQCSNRRRNLQSTRAGRWVPDKDNFVVDFVVDFVVEIPVRRQRGRGGK